MSCSPHAPGFSRSNWHTPKKVSNREIRSLENIINTPKIVNEKQQIVTKPKVITSSKIVIKPKIVIEKTPNYDGLKNRVIKQLKKHFKKLFDA